MIYENGKVKVSQYYKTKQTKKHRKSAKKINKLMLKVSLLKNLKSVKHFSGTVTGLQRINGTNNKKQKKKTKNRLP